MEKFSNWLAQIPPATGGVALGLGTITNSWLLKKESVPEIALQFIWISIALVLTAILLKYLAHPQQLKKDLSCPAISSVLPTTAMAGMVLSSFVVRLDLSTAKLIWLIALSLHLFLLSGFCYFQFRSFRLERMLPAWFVPPVGICVAAVTSPAVQMESIGAVCLWLALVTYLIILPIMLYRLLAVEPIASQYRPMLAILAAPPNLCMAGLLSIYPSPTLALLTPLLVLAVVMTSVVYLLMLNLLQQPFSPAWAAMTFPLAISCFAQYKAAACLTGSLPTLATWLGTLATIQLALASVLISYIALRYLSFLLPKRTNG